MNIFNKCLPKYNCSIVLQILIYENFIIEFTNKFISNLSVNCIWKLICKNLFYRLLSN